MKVSELLRLLKKNGWYLDHHGKRHDVYLHPIKRAEIQIERHQSKEIATGTLNKILNDAGLK